MKRYGWVITKDFLAEGPEGTYLNAVGISGPRGLEFSVERIKSEGKKFQMFDDDGVLYYEGYALFCEEEEPLRDFGQPNAGCTRFKFEEDL